MKESSRYLQVFLNTDRSYFCQGSLVGICLLSWLSSTYVSTHNVSCIAQKLHERCSHYLWERLGILQYVEHEQLPKRQRAGGGCLYGCWGARSWTYSTYGTSGREGGVAWAMSRWFGTGLDGGGEEGALSEACCRVLNVVTAYMSSQR